MLGAIVSKLSSSALALCVVCLLWAGAFARSWQQGFEPNDLPYGVLSTCELVSEPEASEGTLRLAGILRDPEDALFPRELVVTVNDSGILWLNLRATPVAGVHLDPASGVVYRKWSLTLRFRPRRAGVHTLVVTALDTHGAMGEIGRCQFDLPTKK